VPFLARTRPSSKDVRSSGLVDGASRSSTALGHLLGPGGKGLGDRCTSSLTRPSAKPCDRMAGSSRRPTTVIRMEGDLDWKELTELLDSAYQQVAPRRVVGS